MKDETTRDSYTLKLSGKAELPYKLDIGHKYALAMEGTITAITQSDNDDGSHSWYHKFAPVLINVINEKGESIKLPDMRTRSQLLRARFWSYWNKSGSEKSFDDWYEALMANLIQQAPEVCEMFAEK